jgi:LmbE family N-acetylglucosaminyl deacetylase/SAM-dependent methyltransferase
VRSFTHGDEGTPAALWAAWTSEANLPEMDLSAVRRLVVVAAHPDDESLGAGGLIATAVALGLPTRLLVATAGEGSHPASPTHPPEVLARLRRDELAAAAGALGLEESAVTTMAIPDGQVAGHGDEITAAIVDLVGDGRNTLLVAPYGADGHPDHDAMGRCAAAASHRTGAVLGEYPIWLWHAGHSRDMPWSRLVRLPLTASAQAAKRAALACHASQVRPLSDQPGDETILPDTVLAHFTRDEEVFALTAPADAADGRLDQLHAEKADPWGAQSSWYEERKRSLLLAALPRRSFARALEVGCSTGVLAQSLKDRADSLVAVDSSPAAMSLARDRLGDDADLRLMAVPHDWPEGRFDLVVVSEVGYFLSPTELHGLVQRVVSCLTPDGVVVLCHWRHPVRGWPLDAAQVHDAFRRADLPPPAASYLDRDVEIVVHAEPHEWPDHRR